MQEPEARICIHLSHNLLFLVLLPFKFRIPPVKPLIFFNGLVVADILTLVKSGIDSYDSLSQVFQRAGTDSGGDLGLCLGLVRPWASDILARDRIDALFARHFFLSFCLFQTDLGIGACVAEGSRVSSTTTMSKFVLLFPTFKGRGKKRNKARHVDVIQPCF
jgi:hypothetical protein